MKSLLYLKFSESIEVGEPVTYIPDPYSDPCDWVRCTIVNPSIYNPHLIRVQDEKGEMFIASTMKFIKGWIYDEEDLDGFE